MTIMKKILILFTLICAHFGLSAQNTVNDEIYTQNWEKNRRPFAVYVGEFLPMNIDANSETHPLLDIFIKYHFKFFHFQSLKNLPTEFSKKCKYREKIYLFHCDGGQRRIIDLSKIKSLHEFDKEMASYKHDSDKRREKLLMMTIRKHVRTMSQTVVKKGAESNKTETLENNNVLSNNSFTYSGKDISDKEYTAHREALLTIQQREKIDCSEIIKKLDLARRQYKENKIINGSDQLKLPGLQASENAKIALTRHQINRLLTKWSYGQNANHVHNAKNYMVNSHKSCHKHIYAALNSGDFKKTNSDLEIKKRQFITLSYQGQQIEFSEMLIQLPEKYDGQNAYPLLFRFHDNGEDFEDYAATWDNTSIVGQKYITVTPTLSFTEQKNWNCVGFKDFFLKAHNYMLTNFNIDPDKVYFSGSHSGGAAAFVLAQHFPDLCAGIFIKGQLSWLQNDHQNKCLSLIKKIAGFYVVGLNDSKDNIEQFKIAQTFFKLHQNNNVKFYFSRNRETDQLKAYTFLLKHKRNPFPHQFSSYFFSNPHNDENRHDTHYWIKALRFDHKGSVCQISVKNNHIYINSKEVKELELYLNDDIVNLNHTVTVSLNGNLIYHEKVKRSPLFLLNHYESHKDHKRLFWNKIRIKSFE